MATLAKSAVALYGTGAAAQVQNHFHSRKEELVYRRLTLTLTGEGGQTNTITAAALGFDTLLLCSSLFDDTNNLVYGAVVDPVTNTIVLDAGNAGTPTDVTATAYITVLGITTVNPALT